MNKHKNKRRSGFVGLLLLILILFGSTFAFVQMRQAALNAGRVGTFSGGRIHDIYELSGLTGSVRDRHGDFNKNVFAENYGSVPLGVRVRFSEFLATNGEPIITGMELGNTSTWIRYTADADDVTARSGDSALIGDLDVELHFGHDADDYKVFMPTFNQVSRGDVVFNPLFFGAGATFANSVFNDDLLYLFTDTSGRAIDATAGTFMTDLAAPTTFNTVLEILDWRDSYAGFTGQTGYEGHTGEFDFWHFGEERIAPLFYIDEDATPPHVSVDLGPDGEGVRQTARHTLAPELGTDGVMTMAQWLADDMPSGNFWIMDTDGWFYFNGLIPGGEATSMVLNSVTLPPHSNLEHVIHVESDFFVAEEIGNHPGLDDMTDDSKLIFLPEQFRIDPETITTTMTGMLGVGLGDEGVVATYVEELRRYRGYIFIDTVPADFDIEILGVGPSEIRREDYEITLDVATDEIRENIVIRFSEPRAINHIDVIVSTDPIETSTVTLPPNRGNLWTDETGVQWRVIVPASDSHGGLGRALIITEHVFGINNMPEPMISGTPYAPVNEFRNFENSNLRDVMQAWYLDDYFVSPELRRSALNYTFVNNHDRSALGAGIEIDTHEGFTRPPATLGGPMQSGPWITGPILATVDRALTLPIGEVSFNGNGNGQVFALSESEARRFITTDQNENTTVMSRRAFYPLPNPNPNGPRYLRGMPRPWWTRSPGGSEIQPVRVVNTGGAPTYTNADGTRYGFRPALWVAQ